MEALFFLRKQKGKAGRNGILRSGKNRKSETPQQKKESIKSAEKERAAAKKTKLSFTLSAKQQAEYDRMDESQQELFKYFMDDPSADLSKIDLIGDKNRHGGSGRSLDEGSPGSGASSGVYEEEKKPTAGERTVSTVLGGWENSAAGAVDAGRALYAAGQGGRTREMEMLRSDAGRQLDAAKQQLSNLLDDPEKWDHVETAKNYVDYWQRQFDAYDKVLTENVQQRATEETAAMADSLQRSGQGHLTRAKAGLGWLGQRAVDAGASFAQTGGDLLLGASLGPGGGTLPLLARSFGSGTMEARQGGGSLGQQLAYGSLTAGAEVLTEKLSNAALPFKTAYGRGNVGLDRKLDELVAQAVGKYAGTPAGQRVLGGLLGAGKSSGMEGLEEFAGDWLQWQLPRIYGGDVNSVSDQLASSLNSFFTGGFSGIYGAASDPGTYNYRPEANPGSGPVRKTLQEESIRGMRTDNQRTETEYQRALDNYDRSDLEKNVAAENNYGNIIPEELFIRQSPDKTSSRLPSGERPTWRQSEIDVGLRFPDFSPQISFLNGVEVPYGTPGSVRPDSYIPGYSMEVKNYNVTSAAGRNGLINNLRTHNQKRGNHLPANTTQAAIIDIRGQGLSQDNMMQLYTQLHSALGDQMQIRLLID